jgi:hypothetical protein
MRAACRRRQRAFQVALQVNMRPATPAVTRVVATPPPSTPRCSPAKSSADELPPSTSADFQV